MVFKDLFMHILSQDCILNCIVCLDLVFLYFLFPKSKL